ncbi:hypothetical protein [Pseudolysinimonas sp.]|uniref:hypothetical protein n=1 Tax=Pseudolysinimonas sp. TaxID=2680009 RepID=UPI00286D3809|nr:hypothetical protein [Pseudolysinimonas sp.]
MTVPKWLIPVLAIVAAAGVAVAATLIGIRFAAPVVVEAAPEYEIVPVLAPIAEGDEPPAGSGDESEVPAPTDEPGEASDVVPIVVSEAVAEREVTIPADGGATDETDASLLRFLSLLGTWPDPIFGLINFTDDDRGDGDDPCAPRGGEPAGDCPEGLRSTILSDTALRDFVAGGQAFPPTYDEYLVEGNPFGGSLWCDGLTPGDGEVPFGILATAPGAFTVRYWPTADPAAVERVDLLSTTEQIADWEAEVADPEGFAIVQQCLTLGGIEPGTAYTAIISGRDIHDRASPPHTVRFHSGGEPVHPALQLSTVGSNLLLTSALRPDDGTVQIRAALVEDGTAPSCDIPPSARTLIPLASVESPQTPDQVNAVNAPPNFRTKLVQSYAVPEGATVVVCARWFPAGDAPEWERTQADYESSAIVQTADRVLPSVSLFDVARFDDAVDHIDIAVASREGSTCFGARWDRELDEVLPISICHSTMFGAGGASGDSEHLWDRGFSGDLVLRLTTTLTSGEASETEYLIPAADDGCRGVCTPPERQWYRVALADVTQGTGLCGSSFGADCTPPSREVAAGTATFFVDWTQELTNGRSSWHVTPTTDRPVDYVAPDTPQIQNDESWAFSEPTVAVPWTSTSLRVEVDRPVTYTLRFTGNGIDAGPSCADGSLMQNSGTSVVGPGGIQVIDLRMSGLCLGAQYLVTLELVDEAGRATTWSLDRDESWWGGTALVLAPALHATLSYRVDAQTFSRSHLDTFRLELNGSSLGIQEDRFGRCLEDGLIFSEGAVEDLRIYNSNRIEFTINTSEAQRWHDAEAWGVDCFPGTAEGEDEVAVIELDLARLFSRDGIVIDIDDRYNSRVTLRATLTD